MTATATAVTVFHHPSDRAGFHAWLARMTEIAEAAEGFVDSSVAVRNGPELESGFSVTFRSERAVHDFWTRPTGRACWSKASRLGFDARVRT